MTNARAAALPHGVAVEEQELLGVRPGQSGAQGVPVRSGDNLVDVLAALGPGAGEDEFADELGVLHHQGLGDEAAEGEGEDVDFVEPERRDEGVGVIGHRLDTVRHLTGRGSDTAVVEGDDVTALGDGVDDARVPVVQGRGEVDEEDDGDAALGPQLAVGVGDAMRR